MTLQSVSEARALWVMARQSASQAKRRSGRPFCDHENVSFRLWIRKGFRTRTELKSGQESCREKRNSHLPLSPKLI